jgi:hypothetical protein
MTNTDVATPFVAPMLPFADPGAIAATHGQAINNTRYLRAVLAFYGTAANSVSNINIDSGVGAVLYRICVDLY